MDKEYQESYELKELAKRLVERYYLHIGHVDIDSIYFAEILNEKPKTAPVGKLEGVSAAWVKHQLAKENKAVHCIAVYSDAWSELGPSSRQWLVFDLLYGIDPIKLGKVRKPDIQEHGPIAEYFALTDTGIYWRKADILPDMLNGEPLPIPPPPLNDDAGSTVGDLT